MSNEPIKLKMAIAEALEFADEWSKGLTLHEGAQGWRVVCMLLAEEVRRLTQPVGVEPIGTVDDVIDEFITVRCGYDINEKVFLGNAVARLIAERDHAFEVRDAMQAQAKWLAEQNTDFETERDALQDQAKTLQSRLIGAANYIDNLGGVSKSYRFDIAAAEPKEGEKK